MTMALHRAGAGALLFLLMPVAAIPCHAQEQANAERFFAGCTVAAVPGRPRSVQVKGTCLGHMFSLDGFAVAVPCEARPTTPAPPRFWVVSFCNVDGKQYSQLDFEASTGRLLTARLQQGIGSAPRERPLPQAVAPGSAGASTVPRSDVRSTGQISLNAGPRSTQGAERERVAARPRDNWVGGQTEQDGPTLTALFSDGGIPGQPTDAEVRRLAERIVNEHWRKCGASLFSVTQIRVLALHDASGSRFHVAATGDVVNELRNVRLEVTSGEVSPAGRLNGLMWNGSFSVESEVNRSRHSASLAPFTFGAGGSWSSWNNGKLFFGMAISNVNGNWTARKWRNEGNLFPGLPVAVTYMPLGHVAEYSAPQPLDCNVAAKLE